MRNLIDRRSQHDRTDTGDVGSMSWYKFEEKIGQRLEMDWQDVTKMQRLFLSFAIRATRIAFSG